MPLGDSNTRGTWTEPDGGYRRPLQRLLDQAGISYDFVGGETLRSEGMADPEHQGIGGWRITHLADGHTDVGRKISSPPIEELLETYRPDVILLMGGTNDVFGGASGEEITQRLDALLSRIFAKDPRVKVLMANILPITVGKFSTGEVKPQFLTAASSFNKQVPKLVNRYRKQGRMIEFVDINASVRTDQLVDHVHPNTEGMQQMAKVWFKGFQRIQKKQKR